MRCSPGDSGRARFSGGKSLYLPKNWHLMLEGLCSIDFQEVPQVGKLNGWFQVFTSIMHEGRGRATAAPASERAAGGGNNNEVYRGKGLHMGAWKPAKGLVLQLAATDYAPISSIRQRLLPAARLRVEAPNNNKTHNTRF